MKSTSYRHEVFTEGQQNRLFSNDKLLHMTKHWVGDSILSPSPEFPHPRPNISDGHCLMSLVPQVQVPISRCETESEATTHPHLVRLTTVPSYISELGKQYPQKIPRYPRDDSDLRWLRNWLHSLRLHKYTSKLQGLTPCQLLQLEDKDDALIRRRIDSTGVRRKLIIVCQAFISWNHKWLTRLLQAFGEAKKQLAAETSKEGPI